MLSVRNNNRILFPLDPACHLVEPWTRAAELAVGLAAGRMRGCGMPEGGWHGLCSRQREHGDLCPPTAPRWAPRRACQRYLGLRAVRAERQTCLCYQRQPLLFNLGTAFSASWWFSGWTEGVGSSHCMSLPLKSPWWEPCQGLNPQALLVRTSGLKK